MASALQAAQTAIWSYFDTAWAGRTLVQWPNVNFTPPDVALGPAEFVKLDLIWGEGEPTAMGLAGSGRARNTLAGVLMVSLFAPRNTAAAKLMSLTDAVRDLFNRVEVNGVRFNTPSAPKPGDDPRYEMRQVTCGFTVDELL